MSIITIKPGMVGADYVYLTEAIKRWLLDHDVRFVIRYFVKPGSTRINKDIKPEEIEWLAKHGIAIVPNFERHHTDALGGADAANRNARELLEVCTNFGVPAGVPRIMSVDQDIWYPNIDAAEAYVRRSAEIIGSSRIGIYGDDDIAYRCRDLGPMYWRANATGWDGEDRHVKVHVQQHRALYPPGIDPNTAMSEFNAWLPGHRDPTWKDGTAVRLNTKDPKVRLFDSRKSNGPVRAGRDVRIGIPADPDGNAAHSVQVVVTVVSPTEHGHVQVYGNKWGDTSDGNYQPGDIEASSVLTAVGEDGMIGIKLSHGEAHVIVDLAGVYTL